MYEQDGWDTERTTDRSGVGPETGAMDYHFPRFSQAEAASYAEVEINGQTLQLWNYRQLEFPDNCPPTPSMQRDDTIRWILHVQSQITGRDIRFEYGAPRYIVREEARRPLGAVALEQPNESERTALGGGRRDQEFPFGRRTIPTKDHLEVLFDGSLKTKEDMVWRGEGIESLRPGGEGRRHIVPEDHMLNEGVADVGEEGIETLKPGGEGRRHLRPEDHFLNEGVTTAGEEGIETMRTGGEGRRHIQPYDHMITEGLAEIDQGHHLVTDRFVDVHVTGDRKRRIATSDHMMNVGVSSVQEEKNEAEAGHAHGRKHSTYYSGPRFGSNGVQAPYRSTWKRDPSRLNGNTMIC